MQMSDVVGSRTWRQVVLAAGVPLQGHWIHACAHDHVLPGACSAAYLEETDQLLRLNYGALEPGR